MMHKNTILAMLLIASPILFVLAAYPDSFSMSWNQGRGGFLFGLAFIVAEIVGIKFAVSKNRLIFGIPLVIATVIYFITLDFGLHDYIMNAAPAFNVVGCSIGNPQGCIYSWGWLWDFVVITIFVIIAAMIMFGKKWIRIVIAGPVFLGGSAIILSLDTFFPFDTLGPLQYFVPYLVQTNVWVINVLELGLATARDNIMFLQGDHGPFVLQVFWPSAGVHSIIIYSLVMMAFLLKMNIKRKRKIMYFGLGILGTIIINLIRIFSLSIFALKVSTNPVEFEEYHSIAGEIMFLPWLFIFLLVVTAIETKRMKKEEQSLQK
jgi:thaumarchaeosortase